MLRSQDTSTRERKSLNGLWQFRLDPESEGRAARWFSQPLPDSREMAVPASFNDIAADAMVRRSPRIRSWEMPGLPVR
jgi:beta-glucuronidase